MQTNVGRNHFFVNVEIHYDYTGKSEREDFERSESKPKTVPFLSKERSEYPEWTLQMI